VAIGIGVQLAYFLEVMFRKVGTSFAVASLLVTTGCDGGNGNQQQNADPGCARDMPHAVAIKPPEWGTLVRMCASDDGSGARVDNLSSSVIDVSSDNVSVDMTVEDQQATSPVAQAVQAAVPANCLFLRCVLPAGRTLDVVSDRSVSLNFRIDYTKTVVAHMAAALGTSIPRPGPGVVGEIASCADDMNHLTTPAQWQEQVRYAITTSHSCGHLVRQVAGTQEPDEGAVAGHITSIARRLDGGVWIDTLSYETAKILARVH
jgi:hypothetical protein